MLNLVPDFIKDVFKEYINKYIDDKYRQVNSNIGSLSEINKTLEDSKDCEVMIRQILSILTREHNFIAPPPKHLQVRVVGGYVADFIHSGYGVIDDLNGALRSSGKQMSDFEHILDFGCGCGRAVRAIKNSMPEAKIFGTDIDQEAISWLNANYHQFGEYSVAPDFPPTVYRNDMFDFLFGISVFTHLPEAMQFKWLDELQRIVKPGGYLVLTVHGEKHYGNLEKIKPIMKTKGFYYSDFGSNYGKSINLPDYYQTTFHTHDYITDL